MIELEKTTLNDLYLIKPKVFIDHRGFFYESYSQRDMKEAGIDIAWVQDNHSLSKEKGVLRGLHFQNPPHTQTKLVRVIHGSIYDVVVDLRKSSPTFGKWEGFTISASGFEVLYVPKGFAHGFCTLEPDTEVLYKNDDFYEPSSESGVRWNDPTLDIKWPVNDPIISDKDSKLPNFAELESPF